MFSQRLNLERVIRWIARILSLFNTVVLLFFVFGEPFPVFRLRAAEWLGLALFPVGVVVGFVIAWWKEGLGGLITIGSLLAFYLVFGFLLNGNLKQGLGFIFFAFPGLLFLLTWWLARPSGAKSVNA